MSDRKFLIFILCLLFAVITSVVMVNISSENEYHTKMTEWVTSVIKNAKPIPLGSAANPQRLLYPIAVRDGNTLLGTVPHRFQVYAGECRVMTMPTGTLSIYAITQFYDPEQIRITMPPYNTGSINLCAPLGVSTDVVLWANLE